jgi:hypothetical protein
MMKIGDGIREHLYCTRYISEYHIFLYVKNIVLHKVLYESEKEILNPREGHRLKLSGNKVLRRIF